MKLITLAFASILVQIPALAQEPPAPGAPNQAPPAAPAQAAPAEAAPTQAAATFTPEQLEQIVAPIALHPDSLLTMILMSATYPLEIVEAARWVQKNPSLKGKPLEDALKQHEWDPSVKSICGFPTVLKQMNDNLDWTQDLGDAFLEQKKEVMDTVQKMRRKALDAGTLKSTDEQKVKEEDKYIIIESSNPEVIYVPTYTPTAVYGPAWYYPTYYYPPMYPPYQPGSAFFAFSVGVVWGAAVWGNCNWGGSDVDIDIDKHNEFNRNTDRNPDRNKKERAGTSDRGGKQSFKHDPAHRKGANYKNPKTAQNYGAKPGTSRVTKDQARGFQDSSGKGGRGSASTTPSTRNSGGNRASQSPSASTRQRPSNSASSRPSSSTSNRGSGGLSGSRSPSLDRSASSRGAASRGSSGARSSSGSRSSGSRGGGGRGGGGRGGRR